MRRPKKVRNFEPKRKRKQKIGPHVQNFLCSVQGFYQRERERERKDTMLYSYALYTSCLAEPNEDVSVIFAARNGRDDVATIFFFKEEK